MKYYTELIAVRLTLQSKSALLRSGVPCPLTGLQCKIYPCALSNVQNLDVGQLELFPRCLNVKQRKRLQNFTNIFCLRKSGNPKTLTPGPRTPTTDRVTDYLRTDPRTSHAEPHKYKDFTQRLSNRSLVSAKFRTFRW